MELDEAIKQMNQEVSFSEEEKLLLYPLSSHIIKILQENNAFIAGGAITSIFSNNPIKDFDVFFRTKEDYMNTMEKVKKISNDIFCKTHNAVTYKNLDCTNTTIQFIHLPDSFKPDPKDLFNEFDFTVCCGLYDFQEGRFILHRDFLKHLSQRKLIFNFAHKYPISSLLRTQKYKDRGFNLDNKEFLKIIMSISALNIKTNADAAKQMGGMYFGEDKRAFESLLVDESPFDLDKFFSSIQSMQDAPSFGVDEKTFFPKATPK